MKFTIRFLILTSIMLVPMLGNTTQASSHDYINLMNYMSSYEIVGGYGDTIETFYNNQGYDIFSYGGYVNFNVATRGVFYHRLNDAGSLIHNTTYYVEGLRTIPTHYIQLSSYYIISGYQYNYTDFFDPNTFTPINPYFLKLDPTTGIFEVLNFPEIESSNPDLMQNFHLYNGAIYMQFYNRTDFKFHVFKYDASTLQHQMTYQKQFSHNGQFLSVLTTQGMFFESRFFVSANSEVSKQIVYLNFNLGEIETQDVVNSIDSLINAYKFYGLRFNSTNSDFIRAEQLTFVNSSSITFFERSNGGNVLDSKYYKISDNSFDKYYESINGLDSILMIGRDYSSEDEGHFIYRTLLSELNDDLTIKFTGYFDYRVNGDIDLTLIKEGSELSKIFITINGLKNGTGDDLINVLYLGILDYSQLASDLPPPDSPNLSSSNPSISSTPNTPNSNDQSDTTNASMVFFEFLITFVILSIFVNRKIKSGIK